MGKNDDLPLAAFATILGAAIRSRRTAMGLSTSELARRSNGKITRSAIALIEAGKVDARMGSLAALSVALDHDLFAVASRLLAECQATSLPVDTSDPKKLIKSN